jgi:hypothetical protein
MKSGALRRAWKEFIWKVIFTLEQATKAQKGSTGIALLFLYPRRWMEVGGQRRRRRRRRRFTPA